MNDWALNGNGSAYDSTSLRQLAREILGNKEVGEPLLSIYRHVDEIEKILCAKGMHAKICANGGAPRVETGIVAPIWKCYFCGIPVDIQRPKERGITFWEDFRELSND